MRALRSARDFVRQLDFPLYFLAAVLGVYLAAGNLLKGAKWPSEGAWAPWGVWFVLLVIAAVFVPLYALYKGLDAYFERRDREAAELARARTTLDADLRVLCQQVVAGVAENCPDVQINDLAAHVWLCREDGTFDRRARFFLPHLRKSSGVIWRKGKGAAGYAWLDDIDLRADLKSLYRRMRRLGPAAFDQLPAAERFGLTAAETAATEEYTGICAIRLFSTGEDRRLLGFFIIDFTGDSHFNCVAEATKKRPLTTLLAKCEEHLSAFGASVW